MMQIQLQNETITIWVLGFGAHYIKDSAVYSKWYGPIEHDIPYSPATAVTEHWLDLEFIKEIPASIHSEDTGIPIINLGRSEVYNGDPYTCKTASF